MKTIITAFEVIKFGPVHPDYPVDYVCDHIKRKEQSLFRKCYLGVPFYKLIISKLNDYSSVDNYDAETTYQIGQNVVYGGVVLTSLCADNEVHPSDDQGVCWKELPKFSDDCFNQLWECNLRYWLAYEIILTSVDYVTFPMTNHGATKQTSDKQSTQTVSSNELKQLKRKMRTDCDEHLENMLAWMIEETIDDDSDCDFSSVNEVNSSCSDVDCVSFSKRKAQRFYFKK